MTSSGLAGRFIEGDENISFPASDLVRVMMKSLHGLGLRETVAALEKESGLTVQTREAEDLQRAVLAGDWDTCVRMLDHVQFVSEQAKLDAHRMILEEKYLELLERQQIDAAMQCLQNELRVVCETDPSPAAADKRPLHVLASYLVCPTPESLRLTADWPGIEEGARVKLLDKVVELISPQHMVKEGRLEQLIVQALRYQLEHCAYHNPAITTFSLLEDVRDADPSAVLPQHCVHTLEDHTDEVWFVAFSRDGRFLASASKDKTIKIWEFNDGDSQSEGQGQLSVTLRTTLVGHDGAPHIVRWNDDDEHLLSSSSTSTIFLWNISETSPIRTFDRHTGEVTGLDWLPTRRMFVSGSLDRSVLLWNMDGEVLARWGGYRIVDLAVHPSTEQIICASAESHLTVLEPHLEEMEGRHDPVDHGAQEEKHEDMQLSHVWRLVEVEDIPVDKTVVSLHLDDEAGVMLVNFNGGEIQLLNLEDRSFLQVLRGQRQSWFVLRPTLAGKGGSLTISGSEDSRIYIWHTHSGRLLTVLKGHSGTVNCVAWRPGDRCMFASASDDSTIRIWSSAPSSSDSQLNGAAHK